MSIYKLLAASAKVGALGVRNAYAIYRFSSIGSLPSMITNLFSAAISPAVLKTP